MGKEELRLLVQEMNVEELAELEEAIKERRKSLQGGDEKLKEEALLLLKKLMDGDSSYLISEEIPGLVALYGFRDNRESWYKVESEWPEINGQKPWEFEGLIEQVGNDTRPGREKRDMGLLEKGFAVFLQEGDVVKFSYFYQNYFNCNQNRKKNYYYAFKNNAFEAISWQAYRVKAKEKERLAERG